MNGEKSKCLKKTKVLPQSIKIEIPAWHHQLLRKPLTADKAPTLPPTDCVASGRTATKISKSNVDDTNRFLSESNPNATPISESVKWRKICFEISCATSCKSVRMQAKKIQQGFPSSAVVPWVLVVNSLIQVNVPFDD